MRITSLNALRRGWHSFSPQRTSSEEGFQSSMALRSIRVAFPDYPGNDEYEEVVEYIRNAFLMRLNNSRRVYTHVTCATDTENVKFVFEAVADTILRQVLVTAGLL